VLDEGASAPCVRGRARERRPPAAAVTAGPRQILPRRQRDLAGLALQPNG
jgi:hypothetical protein